MFSKANTPLLSGIKQLLIEKNLILKLIQYVLLYGSLVIFPIAQEIYNIWSWAPTTQACAFMPKSISPVNISLSDCFSSQATACLGAFKWSAGMIYSPIHP